MSDHTLLDEILSDAEKDSVTAFIENDTMREAVKKCLLAGIYHNGTLAAGEKARPLTNFFTTMIQRANQMQTRNEELGAQARAAWEGLQGVESAFYSMEKFRRVTLSEPEKNEAR